jgi:hypothetical protein
MQSNIGVEPLRGRRQQFRKIALHVALGRSLHDCLIDASSGGTGLSVGECLLAVHYDVPDTVVRIVVS